MNGKIRRLLVSERGASRFKFLLTVIIIALAIYLIAKFLPPVMEHIKISKLTADFVYQYGDESNYTIKNSLGPKIRKIRSDLGADDIVITRKGKKTTVTIDYSVTVVLIPDKYDQVIDFHIEKSNR
jgi:hypothetical protein